MIARNAFALLALSSALGACATVAVPPPVLTYAQDSCGAQPDLTSAVSLVPPKEKASHQVTVPMGSATPCLAGSTGASPYVVYALPPDLGDKTITVGSVLEQSRIISPEVAILRSDGSVARTFDASDYMYRGPLYSVQFRPREGEAYVLVTVAPARIGQSYDSIAIGTNTTGTVAAGVYVSWTTGSDAVTSRAFSYEGTVAAVVYDTEIDETR